MAKKVVATLKTGETKTFTRVIKMVKSEVTGAYVFKSEIMASEKVKDYLSAK
jgi:hypothetical protein